MSAFSAFMQSAYSYQLLYANNNSAYMGRCGYGPLEDTCWDTAPRLCLSPPIRNHGITKMVRDMHFDSREYAYMDAGSSTFFFV